MGTVVGQISVWGERGCGMKLANPDRYCGGSLEISRRPELLQHLLAPVVQKVRICAITSMSANVFCARTAERKVGLLMSIC